MQKQCHKTDNDDSTHIQLYPSAPCLNDWQYIQSDASTHQSAVVYCILSTARTEQCSYLRMLKSSVTMLSIHLRFLTVGRSKLCFMPALICEWNLMLRAVLSAHAASNCVVSWSTRWVYLVRPDRPKFFTYNHSDMQTCTNHLSNSYQWWHQLNLLINFQSELASNNFQ